MLNFFTFRLIVWFLHGSISFKLIKIQFYEVKMIVCMIVAARNIARSKMELFVTIIKGSQVIKGLFFGFLCHRKTVAKFSLLIEFKNSVFFTNYCLLVIQNIIPCSKLLDTLIFYLQETFSPLYVSVQSELESVYFNHTLKGALNLSGRSGNQQGTLKWS